MAIFLAELKTFTRSRGESAVAAAAYRAALDIPDDRVGLVRRFSHRTGVLAAYPLVPLGAPAWARDVGQLWNAAERAETRSNSRVARELIVSLPIELSDAERHALAHEVGQTLVDRYQVGTLVALHAPDKRGDQRNFHAHLLFTTRALGASGFGPKVRCLDDQKQGPEEVHALRLIVEQLTNAKLEAAGLSERIDRRTLAEQAKAAEESGDYEKAARLTREPTQHLGRAATAAMRRGESVAVAKDNAERRGQHQQDLATYMMSAHAQGRVMPAASDVARPRTRLTAVKPSVPRPRLGSRPAGRTRATGQDAALLNAQAATREANDRASQKSIETYLAGLEQSARDAEAMRAANLRMADAESNRAALVAAGQHDSEIRRLLAESDEARRNLAALRAQAQARRVRYAQAQAERAARQQEADTLLDEAAPARWRVKAHKNWESARRARWGKLRAAIQSEQNAKSAIEPAAMAEFTNKAKALRAEVKRLEEELRKRASLGHQAMDTDAVPTPGPSKPASRFPRH